MNRTEHYSTIDKFLHWTMTGLFSWQFISRWWLASLAETDPIIRHLEGSHSLSGFSIFILGVWRLIHRWRHPAPAMNPAAAAHVKIAAKTNHALLYLAMFIQPLLGFFAYAPRPEAEVFAVYHRVGAWLILSLITLHIAAALWHQFVLRDKTLKRMLPWS